LVFVQIDDSQHHKLTSMDC